IAEARSAKQADPQQPGEPVPRLRHDPSVLKKYCPHHNTLNRIAPWAIRRSDATACVERPLS
ncbi:MAG: hypothetical protein VX346_03000, partial [Planctomycetota bacterium]|nr:hypothetical protein [Planctomycetota bacterium]